MVSERLPPVDYFKSDQKSQKRGREKTSVPRGGGGVWQEINEKHCCSGWTCREAMIK